MDVEVNVASQTDRGTWHAVGADEVVSRLITDPARGLDAGEAARRLMQYGPNRLPEGKKQTVIARFLLQFHNILVYILLAAAFVKMLTGEWLDAAVILSVVIINGVLGFLQVGRAEKALGEGRPAGHRHAAAAGPPVLPGCHVHRDADLRRRVVRRDHVGAGARSARCHGHGGLHRGAGVGPVRGARPADHALVASHGWRDRHGGERNRDRGRARRTRGCGASRSGRPAAGRGGLTSKATPVAQPMPKRAHSTLGNHIRDLVGSGQAVPDGQQGSVRAVPGAVWRAEPSRPGQPGHCKITQVRVLRLDQIR